MDSCHYEKGCALIHQENSDTTKHTSLMAFSVSFDLKASNSDWVLKRAPVHLVTRFFMCFRGLGCLVDMAVSLS